MPPPNSSTTMADVHLPRCMSWEQVGDPGGGGYISGVTRSSQGSPSSSSASWKSRSWMMPMTVSMFSCHTGIRENRLEEMSSSSSSAVAWSEMATMSNRGWDFVHLHVAELDGGAGSGGSRWCPGPPHPRRWETMVISSSSVIPVPSPAWNSFPMAFCHRLNRAVRGRSNTNMTFREGVTPHGHRLGVVFGESFRGDLPRR